MHRGFPIPFSARRLAVQLSIPPVSTFRLPDNLPQPAVAGCLLSVAVTALPDGKCLLSVHLLRLSVSGTVVVLAEAAEDIEQARDFCDSQEPGIEDYCADSLVAGIESLALHHGVHSRHFGFYRMLEDNFLSAFTIAKLKWKRGCSPFWICDAIQIGFAKNFRGAVRIPVATTIRCTVGQ